MENESNEIKESSSDEEIEKKEEPKPKRKQTEKQKECFRIAREKRMQNIAKNNEAKNLQKQEEKVKIEAKIVKKGIAIKKKQIKKENFLEMTQSEESASDYEIPQRKQTSRQRPPAIPERPQIYFI